MKRVFDLVVALLALVILSPILLLIGVGVLIALGRPVFFAQTRPGLQGAPFTIYKFRTMLVPDFNSRDDQARLTKFGSMLRSSSLDELPELWNVVKGNMSLVGPRPLLMEYVDLYTAEQSRRQDMRPGITGWAQVNGRNAVSWDDRFRLDVWYVDNQSFWFDLKIMLMTIAKVIRRDGVSQDGHVTMEPFRGSRK